MSPDSLPSNPTQVEIHSISIPKERLSKDLRWLTIHDAGREDVDNSVEENRAEILLFWVV
jgi:hypothetical protein